MLTKAHKLTIRRLAGLEEEPSGTDIYDFFTGEGEIYQYLAEADAIVEIIKAKDKLFRKATAVEVRRYIVNEMYNASIAHSYSQSLRQARRHFLRKVYPVKTTMDEAYFKQLRSQLKSAVALPHNLDDFTEHSEAFKAYEDELVQTQNANTKKAKKDHIENTGKQQKKSNASSKN